MRIVGTGIDLVEVARIAEAIGRHGERFTGRVFTAAEAAACGGRGLPAQHFAGRFAVKEAVLKALRTGWSSGVHWQDVEVQNEGSGAPHVVLSGGAERRAKEMGITRMHVSISHAGGYAIAHAVAEGEYEAGAK